MSESKQRQRHVPPAGMINVSGRQVTDLARGVMDLIDRSFDQGMQADVAASVLASVAVDLWRANYGDQQVATALKGTIDRRLEKPAAYWGSHREGR